MKTADEGAANAARSPDGRDSLIAKCEEALTEAQGCYDRHCDYTGCAAGIEIREALAALHDSQEGRFSDEARATIACQTLMAIGVTALDGLSMDLLGALDDRLGVAIVRAGLRGNRKGEP